MKIGFIGVGNMATAMINGILSSGIANGSEIIGSNQSDASVKKTAELGINVTKDNRKVAESEIVFLTVKPQFYAEVIDEIKDVIGENQIIVTVAPGWTLERIENTFAKPCKVVRTMPNTPASVTAGMSEICANDKVTETELNSVKELYESFGKVCLIPERLMDIAATATGCTPAYVYMFIEALADAAVKGGLPRKMAYELVAQTVMGSAKMVLESGEHPAALKDAVCSPGGTTIEGVYALEKAGFRSAIIDAITAATDKGKKM